ncbi:zeta toxin family protein [Actinomadura sp. WMMA1423]|uniref:zeta toxin family protein n=1 Tax=Actinomadura sp. WMMA1423 TaxID=2591108 RepID=UPI001146BC37|nr:zeta toxin family protein [Actinomadura sp. WMMA1423]
MGLDNPPGGPGKDPETTDKPTPPDTGGRSSGDHPGADGKTPRADSLRAAGWKIPEQPDTGNGHREDRDDRQGQSNESSPAEPSGEKPKPPADPPTETDPKDKEKPGAGDTEGSSQSPEEDGHDKTDPAKSGTGGTETEKSGQAKPEDPRQDEDEQKDDDREPEASQPETGKTRGDHSEEPSPQGNTDPPEPSTTGDKTYGEGAEDRDPPSAQSSEQPSGPRVETTDDPASTQSTSPTDASQPPVRPSSRLESIALSRAEQQAAAESNQAIFQGTEATDDGRQNTAGQDDTTVPPHSETPPQDGSGQPPPETKTSLGAIDSGDETEGEREEDTADGTLPDEEIKTQLTDGELTDNPPEEPETDALTVDRSGVDEEPRGVAPEAAAPEEPEPSGESEEEQTVDPNEGTGAAEFIDTSDGADEEPDTDEKVEPLTDAEYGDHVREVEAKIGDAHAQGMATDHTYTLEAKGEIWTDERDQIHDEIISDLYARAKDVPNNREAVIAGGLGGAGKSTVLENYAGIDQSRYLTINPDDIKEEMARRDLVPKVEGLSPMEASSLVHEESSYIAKQLSGLAASDGKNVIWDITMASPESTERRIEDLRNAGYQDVKGIFVDIPVETSVARAQARHRRGLEGYRRGEGEGGRHVPEGVIRSNEDPEWGSANRRTFERVKDKFDKWAIYDNSVDGRDPVLVDSSDKDDENRE